MRVIQGLFLSHQSWYLRARARPGTMPQARRKESLEFTQGTEPFPLQPSSSRQRPPPRTAIPRVIISEQCWPNSESNENSVLPGRDYLIGLLWLQFHGIVVGVFTFGHFGGN